MSWTFCNRRDGLELFQLWIINYLDTPPSCTFQVFVSTIPNIFFICYFIWKIWFRKTEHSFEESNHGIVDRETSINNIYPNFDIDRSETSSQQELQSSSNSKFLRYWKQFLRYSPYIVCSLFFLFFFALAGDPSDYTAGLFLYSLGNVTSWTLCGISMTIDLENKKGYRFSLWPGNTAEYFFVVSMVTNAVTTISTETASYESEASGIIIIVVGALITVLNCTLYGICLLRESDYAQSLFQDLTYSEWEPRPSLIWVKESQRNCFQRIAKFCSQLTKPNEEVLIASTDSGSSSAYHFEQHSTFTATNALLAASRGPPAGKQG